MTPKRTPQARCTKHRQDGKPCTAYASPGSNPPACRHHIGIPAHRQRAETAIRKELMRWGLTAERPDIDPGETLLALVAQSRQRVQFYADLQEQAFNAAQRLHEAQLAAAEGALTTAAVIGPVENEWHEDHANSEGGYMIPEDPAVQAARLDLDRVFAQGGVGALIGTKKGVDRYGRVFDEEEAVRGLVRLESEERDRLARFCKLALDAGIAERQIRIAEQQGALLAVAVRSILGDLKLTPEQLELVPLIVPRRLRELSAITGSGTSE